VLWSAVTPRSIKSQDLDCGRRFITENLVLDLHRFEAPLASRSILRSRLSSCLYGSDIGERVVAAIVPAKLRAMTRRVEKLSQSEHDLISEVHPRVNEIKEHVENVREAVSPEK
jgi:hypothetical protein